MIYVGNELWELDNWAWLEPGRLKSEFMSHCKDDLGRGSG